MSNSINKQELVRRVAKRTGEEKAVVAALVDATLEEIYAALKREESVSLRNFGTFYIARKRNGCAFKFNPSQRLRALFGWSSTYRGEP